jgi:hypothetical protein
MSTRWIKKKQLVDLQRQFSELDKASGARGHGKVTRTREFYRKIAQLRGKRQSIRTALPIHMQRLPTAGAAAGAAEDARPGKTNTFEETLAAWSEYQAAVGQEDPEDPRFDQGFFKQVQASVRSTRYASDPPATSRLGSGFGGRGGWFRSGPITRKEVLKAIREAEPNKARDPAGFMNEFFTKSGKVMAHALHVLFDEIWRAGHVPDAWLHANIIPVYKGHGARDIFGSYRPIALLFCLFKIFESIPEDRLRRYVDTAIPPHQRPQLPEGQFGFRKGRSCADAQFVLNEIINHRREQGKATVVAFLDAKQAYDRVWRDGLWHSLINEYKGIDPHLISMVRDCYRTVRGCVVVNGVRSPIFTTLQGLWQGSKLSPLLFLLLFSLLLRWLADDENCGVTLTAQIPVPPPVSTPHTEGPQAAAQPARVAASAKLSVRVAGILSADDCALVAGDEIGMSRLLVVASTFFNRFRILINHIKSAVLHMRSRAPRTVTGDPSMSEPASRYVIQGAPLPIKRQYRYLGAEMNASLSWQSYSDLITRKGRSSVAQLHYVGCRQGGVRYETGMKIMKGLVWPTMTWGAEVINFTPTQLSQQQVVQSIAFRQLLGVDRSCSNLLARSECGMFPLCAHNERAQLRFLHHVQSGIREKPDFLTSTIFQIRAAHFNLQQQRKGSALSSSSSSLGLGSGSGVVRIGKVKQYGWCAMVRELLDRYRLGDQLTSWTSRKRRQWMAIVDRAASRYWILNWRRALNYEIQRGSLSVAFYVGCNPKLRFGPADYLFYNSSGWVPRRAARIRAQLRTSSAPLDALIARHNRSSYGSSRGARGLHSISGICRHCLLGVEEDQAHALSECTLHEADRHQLFMVIEQWWYLAASTGAARAAAPPSSWLQVAQRHFRAAGWTDLTHRQRAQWLLGDDYLTGCGCPAGRQLRRYLAREHFSRPTVPAEGTT